MCIRDSVHTGCIECHWFGSKRINFSNSNAKTFNPCWILCASLSKFGTIKGVPNINLYLFSIFKNVAGNIGTWVLSESATGPFGKAAKLLKNSTPIPLFPTCLSESRQTW